MRKKTAAGGPSRGAGKAERNFCFGCGRDNPQGMGLKFFPGQGRDQGGFVAEFRLGRRYTGPPGHCHGGIIATILDEAMSKLSRLDGVTAATRRMTVEYLRPVPLHKKLRVRSEETGKRGRRLSRAAEILDDKGTVLARGQGEFVIVDPARVFGKKRRPREGRAPAKAAPGGPQA